MLDMDSQPNHQGMTDSNICNNCSIQRMHYALSGQVKRLVCVCVKQRRGGQPWSVRGAEQWEPLMALSRKYCRINPQAQSAALNSQHTLCVLLSLVCSEAMPRHSSSSSYSTATGSRQRSNRRVTAAVSDLRPPVGRWRASRIHFHSAFRTKMAVR